MPMPGRGIVPGGSRNRAARGAARLNPSGGIFGLPRYGDPVPRFYFHGCNGNGFVEDEEGRILASTEAARSEALTGARDIMAGEMMRGEIDLGSFIEVEDETHQLLFTLTFEEAVKVIRRS